ncbi:C-type lectin domain family 9 member A [Pogona vitticeps]
MSWDPTKDRVLLAKTQTEILPGPSLKMKLQGPQKPEDIRRGPAFLSNTNGDRPKPQMERLVHQLQPQPQPKREVQVKILARPSIPEGVTWWQIFALALMTAALILFFTLMGLIYVYMMKAERMNTSIRRLQRMEMQLKVAVRQQAGNSVLTCKPCKDNWLQWGDNCYLGTHEPMTWNECIDHCEIYGASFLIGGTSGEMEFLILQARKWLASKSTRSIIQGYWVGLMYNGTEKIWSWANGAHLHLNLREIETRPPSFLHACVLFTHPDDVITKHCSSLNYCLCKRSA